MPVAYGVDLRWRIVWTYLVRHLQVSELATLFSVSEKSARRYIALFFQTGDAQSKKQRHGPQKLLGEYERLVLLELILGNPGIYLREVREKLALKFGTVISPSTICKTLKFMGCSRQVMCQMAKQRSDISRAHFVSIYDPKMCFCFWTKVGMIGVITFGNMGTVFEACQ